MSVTVNELHALVAVFAEEERRFVNGDASAGDAARKTLKKITHVCELRRESIQKHQEKIYSFHETKVPPESSVRG